MALEKEIKFKLVNFSEIRAKLESLGATFLHRQLESNEIWDLPDLRLKNSHSLLRLRTEEFVGGQTRSILTFKSKPLDCPDESDPNAGNPNKNNPGENDNGGDGGEGGTNGCKTRHEDETVVQDSEAMRRILRSLGYIPLARYQKLREEWSLSCGPGNAAGGKDKPGCCYVNKPGQAVFCLDYLPFGCFLEIEAHDPAEFAGLLGLNPMDSLIDSYHKLNKDRQGMEEKNISPDFVFDEKIWRQLRETLATPLP